MDRTRWQRFVRWLKNAPGGEDFSHLAGIVQRAAAQSDDVAKLSAAARTAELDALPANLWDDDISLVRFLALVREVAEQTVGLRPFDVQLQATAAMLRGVSVQLATGEGKTLIGAMVAAGWALSGRHVHVLTSNDYLAERDAEWMAPLLTGCGVEVASVTSTTPPNERRGRYRSLVVYLPVTEAGFDVLRDRICLDETQMVGIAPDAALVDEADAVLIDEASVPLVLAGDVPSDRFDNSLVALVDKFSERVDFEVPDDRRTVHLTDAGTTRIEQQFPTADLFGADAALLTRVQLALHAKVLLIRDVDYVVGESGIGVISQSRGRIDALQRWPEGLQDAIEAKEGIDFGSEALILDQLRLEDLIGLYRSVSGMSATLVPAAEELAEFYELRVGPLPPNLECVRVDEPDRLHADRATRDDAAVDFISARHLNGQPVLVATQSVAESESFADLLRASRVECAVLNAKTDEQEAHLVARAGQCGRVTISTQMAGRGTDIRLGPGAVELGGLCVVGLGRFRSQRLDDQLRGRAGRQGDPGRSVYFTSVEDDLVVRHGPELVDSLADHGLGRQVQHGVERCQRIAEAERADLHRLSRRYAALLMIQRRELLAVRAEVIDTELGAEELRHRLPERMRELGSMMGPSQLAKDVRTAVLMCLDARWCAHLGFAMSVREGIHLRALAREQPIDEYNRLLVRAYRDLIVGVYADAEQIVHKSPATPSGLDLTQTGIEGPASTWTYMVTDDHFGSEWARIGRVVKEALRPLFSR